MTQETIKEQFIIGLDDTDAEGTPGTGALAMALAAKVEAEGWGTSLGVIRHELLHSDKFKYTKNNYCYSLVIESPRSALDLEDDLVDYVRGAAAKGSDTGLAIMTRHADLPHVLAFGRRAQTEVMRLEWAYTFAIEANVTLRALGRERRGTIGALAAAGLRFGGIDGVYIDLRGIRDLKGRVVAGQIRERTAIDLLLNDENEPLDRDDPVETFDWIRPLPEDGKAVVRFVPSPENRHVYYPAHRLVGEDVDGQ
ncbi:MAG: hypothetical protein EXR68_02795 [Dehalococcoidia bacterium]|nr:hypothetical protein [Dehalococcoidia bacterium]